MGFWAAAHVHRHREHIAVQVLAMRGYETYEPRIRESRIIHGRKTIATSPLFPSYLFIKIELQWSGALSCPGVANLIGPRSKPSKVPDSFIAELQNSEHEGYVELPDQKPVSGIAWDGKGMVHVRAGPFLGFTGLAKGMSGPKVYGCYSRCSVPHAQSNFPSVMLFHFSCGLFR